MQNILIIKLGALGDFIQATGAFSAIRKKHKDDRLTLLTTQPFVSIAEKSGFFDSIIVDKKPKWWQLFAWVKLAYKLKNFEIVYDLQTSGRTSRYFCIMKILCWQGDWCGIAKGCRFFHNNPNRNFMHTIDRIKDQLALAGIEDIGLPDISFLLEKVDGFELPDKYFLLVAGGAPHRPLKRWSASNYAELANNFVKKGFAPVLLGTEKEKNEIDFIVQHCQEAISLAGKTSISQIVSIAKKAEFAVGNDTGPMHIIAASGCRSVVLFSAESNPQLCAPRGKTLILQKDNLNDLNADEVIIKIEEFCCQA